MRPPTSSMQHIGRVLSCDQHKITLQHTYIHSLEYNNEKGLLTVEDESAPSMTLPILNSRSICQLWNVFYWYRDADDFLKSIKIPSGFTIFSNNSNPYSNNSPDQDKDIQIFPGTAYDLCEAIDKIKDSENNLCVTNKDDVVRFWFCWKD